MDNEINDFPCSFIIDSSACNNENLPSNKEITNVLLSGETEKKISILKRLIISNIHDENYVPPIFLVLKYLVPIENHEIKKLLYLFWESIEKRKPDGSLKDEILLACNNFRKDLTHSNEFIRGKTLKLISRIMFRELLEPLIDPICVNLEHKFAYVRKNAIACLFRIYVQFGKEMIGGVKTEEKLEIMLENEKESSTRRNVFLLLYHLNEAKSIEIIRQKLKSFTLLTDFEDILQIMIIELLRKSCISEPLKKPDYLPLISQFSNSKYNVVILEYCNAIISLTKNPEFLKSALIGYFRVLINQNENNVILFILDKIKEIISQNLISECEEFIKDLLEILKNDSLQIKQKIIEILENLVNEKNIREILSSIHKIMKINDNFCEFWIDTLQKFSIKFPKQIYENTFIQICEKYLINLNQNISLKSAKFIANCLSNFPEIPILPKIIEILLEIKNAKTFEYLLWIIGKFSKNEIQIENYLIFIYKEIISNFIIKSNEIITFHESHKKHIKTVILPDGTYSTQQILLKNEFCDSENYMKSPDFWTDNLKSAIIFTITKLTMKFYKQNLEKYNKFAVETLINIMKIINISKNMDLVYKEKIFECIKLLSNPQEKLFNDFISENKIQEKNSIEIIKKNTIDFEIKFRQFNNKNENFENNVSYENFNENIENIYPLTSYSEPIYAELICEQNNRTIVLTYILINRTTKTLHNISLEVSLGSFAKLVSGPQIFNLSPSQIKYVKAVFVQEKSEICYINSYITFYGASGNMPHFIKLDTINFESRLNELYIENVEKTDFCEIWNKFNFKISKTQYILNDIEKLQKIFRSKFEKCEFCLNSGINLLGKTKLGDNFAINLLFMEENKDFIEFSCEIRADEEKICELVLQNLLE